MGLNGNEYTQSVATNTVNVVGFHRIKLFDVFKHNFQTFRAY